MDVADTEFNLTLKGAELATLMAIIGSSPLIVGNERNAKFVTGIDKSLSKYYTLADLGVVPGGASDTTNAVCLKLFSEFNRHVEQKMEITKGKLACPVQ